jgi:hypothetical protein
VKYLKTLWKNLSDTYRLWRQWWRCCRKHNSYYICQAYKECYVCETIYWRD